MSSSDDHRPTSAPSKPRSASRALAIVAVLAGSAAVACGGSDGMTDPGDLDQNLQCMSSFDQSLIFDGGVGRGGIPALSSPPTSQPGGPNLNFLSPDNPRSRVFVVPTDDRAYIVPQNIMWWHEIVNVTLDEQELAITTCPLTGSTLAFKRDAIGGDEFVVSGLLFFNNQVMAPRGSGSGDLWPQLARGAACGPNRGTTLEQVPVLGMEWAAARELYPNARVVNSNTDFDRDYTRYPYGNYDNLSNSGTLGFPLGELDDRRPPKERVLGVPTGGFKGGGLALPFLELETAAEDQGGRTVVRVQVEGGQHIVFWDTDAQAAVAFDPQIGGQELTFRVQDGSFVDDQTGSTWRLDGRAISGPMEGEQLQTRAKPFVAFWFAWAFFQPDTEIWSAPGSSS